MSGFLERWSRKKRAADEDAGKEPETGEPVEALAEPEELESDDDLPDEEVLKALPSLDEITLDTNIMPFLQRGVPRAMKNAALRKMWLLDPRIRDHKDLAVDYAWDWNTPGGVPGNSGTIGTESAAKLVRSLFGAPTEEEPKATSPEEPQPESTESELPAEVVSMPADSVREPAKREEAPAEREIAIARADVTGSGQENALQVVRRRHGGAMPE